MSDIDITSGGDLIPIGVGKFTIPKKQLELPLKRVKEPDRNYHLGGRSFYFFDFDDNIAFLSTKVFLFHKETHDELAISSSEYVEYSKSIGSSGPFKDYYVDGDDRNGSFRRFRDLADEISLSDQTNSASLQPFVEDIREVLNREDLSWKGPSWGCFFHACYNQRPVSLITARGHHPNTIMEGVESLVKTGHLPKRPNYHGIYPVNHIHTRTLLSDADPHVNQSNHSVPRLKQLAIRHCVESAFAAYGYNPHHRFGMSDDDPQNIELILDEMQSLKSDYPEVSFFLIETKGNTHFKLEVQPKRIQRTSIFGSEQLSWEF